MQHRRAIAGIVPLAAGLACAVAAFAAAAVTAAATTGCHAPEILLRRVAAGQVAAAPGLRLRVGFLDRVQALALVRRTLTGLDPDNQKRVSAAEAPYVSVFTWELAVAADAPYLAVAVDAGRATLAVDEPATNLAAYSRPRLVREFPYPWYLSMEFGALFIADVENPRGPAIQRVLGVPALALVPGETARGYLLVPRIPDTARRLVLRVPLAVSRAPWTRDELVLEVPLTMEIYRTVP